MHANCYFPTCMLLLFWTWCFRFCNEREHIVKLPALRLKPAQENVDKSTWGLDLSIWVVVPITSKWNQICNCKRNIQRAGSVTVSLQEAGLRPAELMWPSAPPPMQQPKIHSEILLLGKGIPRNQILGSMLGYHGSRGTYKGMPQKFLHPWKKLLDPAKWDPNEQMISWTSSFYVISLHDHIHCHPSLHLYVILVHDHLMHLKATWPYCTNYLDNGSQGALNQPYASSQFLLKSVFMKKKRDFHKLYLPSACYR